MKELLRECFELMEMTNDFAIAAQEVARRKINRRRQIPRAAREEAEANFALKLVKKWDTLLDPTRCPKAYLGSMATSALMDVLRKFDSNRRKIDRLAEEPREQFHQEEDDRPLLEKMGYEHGCQLSSEQLVLLRQEAVRQYSAGLSRYAIAKKLGVTRMTVGTWINRWSKEGSSYLVYKKRIECIGCGIGFVNRRTKAPHKWCLKCRKNEVWLNN